METYADTDDKEVRKKTLNLITHAPIAVKKKKTRHTAVFDSLDCNNCPNHTQCPVKAGKKYHYLRYTEKEMRIAKRRAYEQTDEFKDRYRWRSGVEATMSEYDRRTGVKRLRVRGFKAVRFCATLKAAGVNILRADAVWLPLNRESHGDQSTKVIWNHAFLIIKEQFLRKLQILRETLLWSRQNQAYGH